MILRLVGLFFVALIHPLWSDLWRASWLVQMNDNECEPMFLSFFIPLGIFLLLAVRKPTDHRSLIAFAAWWSLAHASVMLIETFEAWKHGVHRDFNDVIIAAVIGFVLLPLVPAKGEAPGGRERHPS